MNKKPRTNYRCGVIGHGSWATAIVNLLTSTESQVNWYVRNPKVVDSLRTEGRNCRYLRDVELDMTRIMLSDDLNKVVDESDLIFLSVPSPYLKIFLEPLTTSIKDKFIVSTIKGIVPGEYQTVTEYMHDHYKLVYDQIGLLTGPTHAEEVSHNRLSYFTMACVNLDNARLVGEKMKRDYVAMNYSSDIHSVEYAAVLKNIFSVTVGMAVGLGYGDNFLSVLVSNCAKEMALFLDKHCSNKPQMLASNYLGDLLVSCYSSHSRNRQFGMLIGRGDTVNSALNEMTMVAEGYFGVDYFRHIAKKELSDMPITRMTYKVLYEDEDVRKAMKKLEEQLV